MASLGSTLLQSGLLTAEQLRDAYREQVLRGGTLDTVLLERRVIDEAALIAVIARATGYRPLTPALLEDAGHGPANDDPFHDPYAPSAGISIERAAELAICPLADDGERLTVLCTEVTNHVALEELTYGIGRVADPVAATELRVLQARTVVYDSKLAPRYYRLLRRCGLRFGPQTTRRWRAGDSALHRIGVPLGPVVG